MPRLVTRAKSRPFEYERLADGVVQIWYGDGNKISIAAIDIERLIGTFKGQIVELGASRTNPRPGTVGDWLQSNVKKTAIASYVGPILVHEGLAAWGESIGGTLRLRIL